MKTIFTQKLKWIFIIGMMAFPFTVSGEYQKLSPESDLLSAQEMHISEGLIYLKIQDRNLKDVLQSIQHRSGIQFEVPSYLLNENLNKTIQTKNWKNVVTTLLQDFNRVGFIGENGRLKRVLITGISGSEGFSSPAVINGAPPIITFPENQWASPEKNKVKPSHLRGLTPGSVLAINIDKNILLGMKLGDILSLNLPSGQHDLMYDRRIDHENGDVTWIGRLMDEGNLSKVILTLGKEGNFGRIFTNDGVFRIESTGANDWLIDVETAGITPGNHSADGIDPVHVATSLVNQETTTALLQPITSDTVGTKEVSIDNTTQTGITEIDLMVVYPLLSPEEFGFNTRINNLVAIANQAYSDSQIQLSIRLVHTEPVDFSNSSDNRTVLYELTQGQGPFSGIAELRNTVGADLVSLIRPFNAESHGGCGTGWIGGIAGSDFHLNFGFSVVSDGIHERYYCTDYTLAHELGHNMGASHDRDNSNFQGKFPFSYGYGRQGEFGTIMSYLNPEIGIFSNPDLEVCLGQPCGVNIDEPNSANNALTLNSSRHTIADFMESVEP